MAREGARAKAQALGRPEAKRGRKHNIRQG